jgi:hypothetical protein
MIICLVYNMIEKEINLNFEKFNHVMPHLARGFFFFFFLLNFFFWLDLEILFDNYYFF